jgi:cob(I)alamin adenosyltransferase
MRIYTRRGDDGETDLRGQQRVSKASQRVEAYGSVDETNAVIGRAYPTEYDDLNERLATIQSHLHIVQADLATPDADEGSPRITDDHVETLEEWINAFSDELDPLQSFILPGGSEHGSRLHHARAVCRRAERRAIALADAENINDSVIAYLNRLSDALFTFARLVNHREGVAEKSPDY